MAPFEFIGGPFLADVRFGSKANMTAPNLDVRFTPQKRTFVRASGMSAEC